MKDPIDQAIGVFRECEALNLSSADQRLIKMQIEALEGIRKSLSDIGSMGYQIQGFEKLISDAWMENQAVFERTYSAWENFRCSYARDIGAMTVNERLCYMGLMRDYEDSAGRPDSMRAVLRAAFLSPSNIEAIILQK